MGAPIPRAIVREAKAKLPGTTVLGGWGQSENALVTLGIPGDPRRRSSTPTATPGPACTSAPSTPRRPRRSPQADEGRLQVTGPFLFVGYAERLEQTRESFDGEWFDTGDLARIDADGYVNISGRTKDVIIRGGENIPVAYVENALYENPKLASVAVVGDPGPAAAGARLRLRRAEARRRRLHLRRDAGVPGGEGRGQAVLAGEARRPAPTSPRPPAARSRSSSSATRSRSWQ